MPTSAPPPFLPARSAAGLRALAHPARRTLVEHLARVDVEDPGHLADLLWSRHRLAQPSTSKHLRRLTEARLVRPTAVAGSLRHALCRDVLAEIAAWAGALAAVPSSDAVRRATLDEWSPPTAP